MSEKILCGGLIERPDLCLVEIWGLTGGPDTSRAILEMIGDAGVALAYLSQTRTREGERALSLCVEGFDAERMAEIVAEVRERYDPRHADLTGDMALLTLYGPHFNERHALAGSLFAGFVESGVRCFGLNSAVNSITCLVPNEDVAAAREGLRARFVWPE